MTVHETPRPSGVEWHDAGGSLKVLVETVWGDWLERWRASELNDFGRYGGLQRQTICCSLNPGLRTSWEAKTACSKVVSEARRTSGIVKLDLRDLSQVEGDR